MADKSYVRNRLYASLSGTLSFGNWLIAAMYQVQPDYDLSGNSYSTKDRQNTVKTQYKHKNWLFLLTGVDMFTERGNIYENIVMPDVHPEEYSQCVGGSANILLLGMSYRLDFGKKRNNTRRSLNNKEIEWGIDIDY